MTTFWWVLDIFVRLRCCFSWYRKDVKLWSGRPRTHLSWRALFGCLEACQARSNNPFHLAKRQLTPHSTLHSSVHSRQGFRLSCHALEKFFGPWRTSPKTAGSIRQSACDEVRTFPWGPVLLFTMVQWWTRPSSASCDPGQGLHRELHPHLSPHQMCS